MFGNFLTSNLNVRLLAEIGWMSTYMTTLWREICRQLQRPSKQKGRSLRIQLVCISQQVEWSYLCHEFCYNFWPFVSKRCRELSELLFLAAIDAPGGFLFEWWSVFWDIFIARTNEKHSDVAASYIEVSVCASNYLFMDIFNVSGILVCHAGVFK